MISAALYVIEDEKQRSELAIFYQKYKHRFYNIAFSKTNDPDESEDAVQEAFARIAKKPECFFNIATSEERLRYVDGIVRHIAIDTFKKRTKIKTISLDEMGEDIPSENITPEEKYITDISADDIVRFTLTLPENHRQALFMYIHQRLSYSEISETLNISEELARKRVSIARKAIKNYVEGRKDE